jgi:hypothetical protein
MRFSLSKSTSFERKQNWIKTDFYFLLLLFFFFNFLIQILSLLIFLWCCSDVDATMLACIAFSCPNLESMEILKSDTAINRITGYNSHSSLR